MNGSGGFEGELHDRLVAFAEPAPPVTRDVVAAVRRGAQRRRRRMRVTAAAAALVVAVGSATVVWQAVPDAAPAPPGRSAVPPSQLLGWPTRTSGDSAPGVGPIERAWSGGHTAFRVLYAGALPPESEQGTAAGGVTTQVAVVEGRNAAGEARVAVLTGRAGTWQVRLDAAGFGTPPGRLFVVLDGAAGPSWVIALSAPGSPAARVNNLAGQPLAFLVAGSVEVFPVPGDAVTGLQLHVSPPSSDLETWTLRRWATQGAPGARVRLVVPAERVR
ncbi:hypothetical protein [Micromonospora cathayae]|uniref:Uncharacterized protein n=1 Tax=Micromonospora cathayae TaxID=3028804 RepID=A0ABY7ZW49_9ACTN|nr:hypothetical protein [Micromonospora sp. HUAS 3]WDZ86606.1 hypothetical protein PVK37_09505 [Micromonospora sp. HUAS 3]